VFDNSYFKNARLDKMGVISLGVIEFNHILYLQLYIKTPCILARKCACVIVTTLMIVRCLFWFHWVLYFGRWWVSDECLRHLAHSLFGSVAGQLLWHQHEPQSREGFRLRVECATSTQVNNAQPQSSGIV